MANRIMIGPPTQAFTNSWIGGPPCLLRVRPRDGAGAGRPQMQLSVNYLPELVALFWVCLAACTDL
jgi:hypothetical protein